MSAWLIGLASGLLNAWSFGLPWWGGMLIGVLAGVAARRGGPRTESDMPAAAVPAKEALHSFTSVP